MYFGYACPTIKTKGCSPSMELEKVAFRASISPLYSILNKLHNLCKLHHVRRHHTTITDITIPHHDPTTHRHPPAAGSPRYPPLPPD